MTLALLAAQFLLCASSSSSSGDLGVDDETDFIAPYLGLSLLDGETLAEDNAEEEAENRPQTSAVDGSPAPVRPVAAPAWTSLLPNLSVSLVRREVVQVRGVDGFGLSSGTIFLVSASFGGAPPHARGANPGFQLASVRRTVRAPQAHSDAVVPEGEPTIAEVQRAAEHAALVHLDDLTGWRSRARTAAWLPEVSADYRRNVGEIDTLGISSNLGIDSHNIEDVSRYGVRASWQLSQLVFSREEIGAAQAAMSIQQTRQELLTHVTELYFQRLRLRLKMSRAEVRGESSSDPPGEPEHETDGGEWALKLAELTAKLDALTGGAFSEPGPSPGEEGAVTSDASPPRLGDHRWRTPRSVELAPLRRETSTDEPVSRASRPTLGAGVELLP